MGTVNQTKQPHTPGPWETREVAHEATPFGKRRVYRLEVIAPQYLYGKRTHSRDICQMVDYCEWTDHPANARLIAAAPDLLAALQKMTAWVGGMSFTPPSLVAECDALIEQAQGAIAKVEGK